MNQDRIRAGAQGYITKQEATRKVLLAIRRVLSGSIYLNERVAALPGLRDLHPYEPEDLIQGALELMDTLGIWLAEIAGLARTTLQPAAGAHGTAPRDAVRGAAALRADGPSVIENADAASVSFPEFWSTLERIAE